MGYKDMGIDNTGGKFLKIKGGEHADLHILSEEPYHTRYHGFGKDRTTCLMSKDCNQCKMGDRPKQRWMINIWNRGLEKVQVFEFGPSIAKQIQDIAEMLESDGHSIHSTDLRIKATGSGMDTEYTVMQRTPEGEIPDDVELYKLP